MWLLDAESGQLIFFANEDQIPPYAILSHTWSQDEVSFQDIMSIHTGTDLETKNGWLKIWNACRFTMYFGLRYVWIDTCCIDKSSSAELQEAINSMFRCLERSSFRRSRWFKRGWTLQELLAPIEVVFYDKDWKGISTRGSIGDLIGVITGIRPGYLSNDYRQHEGIRDKLSTASVAERMSWMNKRETTRPEDVAYCLLGIFDINMPMLYGEAPCSVGATKRHVVLSVWKKNLFLRRTPLLSDIAGTLNPVP
ncbi:heterokaryon incompatibility [Fusarium sporotrichioides]|uniref:Heterokaryon incompatibility n=1 Tax=Fusarium sporotrichioides TaxID=5514 RepID=A0A395S6G9_FUSSP|nr:heterokaryon incompatibility [Fusarium sporotrichioides]